MDQDNTKGQDKRNWRERLGIGAQGNAQGNKELPKISDDFRKEPAPAAARPVASARPAPRPAPAAVAPAPVKPAPMAPRAVSRATPQAPVSPDKLAERLRSQREASTRLAEQRVQVAKQRAEAPAAPKPQPVAAAPVPPTPAAKPKFTFAEEGADTKPAAPAPRPASVQPLPPSPVVQAPQLSPARPPLGGGVPPLPPGFPQQRPQPPAYQPQAVPGYPPAGQLPPGYPPTYGQQPVPPYRPIDPNSGYAPQPGYVPPQRGFGVPPQQGGFAPPTGPRLNVPPRPDMARQNPGLNPGYQPQQDFGAQAPIAPGGFAPQQRVNRPPLRGPAPPPQEPAYEEEFYDEAPPPRAGRPSSNDYQQAYREAEYGYEEEAPRSKAPWILAGLLLLALLIAGLGVWGYQTFKPGLTGQSTTDQVPAVAAPDTPAKVEAEQPAAQQPAVATPTKKQIYDRIVGDQEVLGGDVSAPAETPAAIPEPTTNDAAPAAAPANGTGEDAAPLPIPPPPGGASDQQGSLAPATEKQSAENITPAAGESQAAVAAQNDLITPPAEPAAAPPAPGEISSVQGGTRSLATEPDDSGSETISDEPAPAPKIKTEVAEKKKAPAVKEKAAQKKLGSKPVVLVPASKKAKAAASQPLDDTQVASGSDASAGGLYDNAGTAAPAPVVPDSPAAAPVKKKKTLADLFSSSREDAANTANDVVDVASVEQPEPAPAPKVTTKKVAPAPAPVEQASAGGGYVVQLASFRSRDEATREYARLRTKHAVALGRFSPIISEASVGGSTRYRLSVGSMENQAQASAVCSSLFAGGERDCLVKKR